MSATFIKKIRRFFLRITLRSVRAPLFTSGEYVHQTEWFLGDTVPGNRIVFSPFSSTTEALTSHRILTTVCVVFGIAPFVQKCFGNYYCRSAVRKWEGSLRVTRRKVSFCFCALFHYSLHLYFCVSCLISSV